MKKALGVLFAALLISGMPFASVSADPVDLNFYDTFESYAPLTPLVNGLNGWYASSEDCIVQNAIASAIDPPGSTNAVAIPIDVTLSNRVQNTAAITSVWVRLDVRPVHYDGIDDPVVDPNATVMFYINSNGYYVTHDNAGWQTNTVSPVSGEAAVSNSATDFVRIHLYQNYTTKTWDIFSGYNLVTNDLSFINNAIDHMSGFDVYNGGSTTFLDNVFIITNLPADLGADGGDWLPDLGVSTNVLSRTIFEGQTAASQSVEVWKTNGFFSLFYTNTVTSGDGYVAVDPATASGTSTNEHKTVNINYDTAALPVQTTPHTARIRINGYDSRYGFASTNAPAFLDIDINVQDMTLSPATLTRSVMKGFNATGQDFDIASTGSGSYDYTVLTNNTATWLTVGNGTGVMTDADTNTVNITYTTLGLAPGLHESGFNVVSTTGSGLTQSVDVVMNVMELAVAPNTLNNTVEYGSDAAAQFFEVWNTGSGDMGYTITTNAGDWFVVSPGTGSSAGEKDRIDIAYNTANLAPGEYTGEISVAADAGGDPEIVAITLTVGKKQITVGGAFTADNKAYDHTVDAAISANNLTLTGVVGGDEVTLSPVAAFEDYTVGQDKTVVLTDETTLTGADAANYTLSLAGAPETTADITPGELIITGTFTAEDKTYDGTTTAVILENNLALQGVIDGEAVTLNPVAAFIDAEVGQDKTVVLTDETTLTGADAANYILSLAGAPETTASILASGDVELTVTPTSLSSAVAEGEVAPERYFEVWNAGDGEMGYKITSDSAWLSVSPASGLSTGKHDRITVSFDSAALPAGDYDGNLTVTAGVQTKTVAVSLSVVTYSPADALNVDPLKLSVQTRRNINARTLTFDVWNSGTNALGYTVTSDAEWMTPSPDGGVSSGERNTIEVVFDTIGMIRGRYTGALTVESSIGETNIIEVFLGIGAAPYDFDGDSKSDPWYYHHQTGMWYYRLSSTLKLARLQFGFPGATPVPGDYDGDGQTDHAVYDANQGLWYILTVAGEYSVVSFGFPGTVPVPNDYDGDGITDPAIYYPSMGKWYILASGGDYWELQFGFPGTTPVPADYSGDLKADIAVYYPPSGLWYIWTWTGDYWEIPFGWNETLPAPGDYDGSGKADMAVYYPPSGLWYIWTWAGDYSVQQFGFNEAAPAAADYDGDGVMDKGVFYKYLYDATWYLLRSSEGFESISSRDSRP